MCSRSAQKISVEPARVNIFLIVDQIISIACLAGVHPQNSTFMTDLFFFRLCLAYSFIALFSLLIKALGKEKHVSHTQFVQTIPAYFLASKSVSKLSHVEVYPSMARVSEFTYHTHKTHKCARLPARDLCSRSLTVIYHYQAASQGLTDGCHLNSAPLKPLTVRPPSSACHYYTEKEGRVIFRPLRPNSEAPSYISSSLVPEVGWSHFIQAAGNEDKRRGRETIHHSCRF